MMRLREAFRLTSGYEDLLGPARGGRSASTPPRRVGQAVLAVLLVWLASGLAG